uniref:Protein Wnt n=1 Tax=Pristionchus pacificus TaxID=54126 RepID=A0A2A6CC23_PRIPA|eukprot:PDM75666.1 hypothetical protein PRIPAC_43802 [Pristionchus pacificus]
MTPLFFLLFPFILPSVSTNELFNEPIPKEPHWWKVIWMKNRIQELRIVLPPRLYRLLSSDPQLPLVLKESLLSALSSCKQSGLEKNEKLTCSYQSGRPYADLFTTISAYGIPIISTVPLQYLCSDTRDFSFLISLTTAFAVRSIAEACAEGRLKKCSCDNRYTGAINGRPHGFYWNPCIHYKGSHNLPYALKLTRKLIDYQYECVVPARLREIILHNISVGRTKVTTSVSCSCESPYDCDEKCCQLRVIDESTILGRVRESLWNSRRMRRSNRVEMKVGMCYRKNRDRKYRNKRTPIWYIDDGRFDRPSFYLGIPE